MVPVAASLEWATGLGCLLFFHAPRVATFAVAHRPKDNMKRSPLPVTLGRAWWCAVSHGNGWHSWRERKSHALVPVVTHLGKSGWQGLLGTSPALRWKPSLAAIFEIISVAKRAPHLPSFAAMVPREWIIILASLLSHCHGKEVGVCNSTELEPVQLMQQLKAVKRRQRQDICTERDLQSLRYIESEEQSMTTWAIAWDVQSAMKMISGELQAEYEKIMSNLVGD